MRIRAARIDDVPSLIEIERAASDMFRSLGMDFVADDDPGSAAELAPYIHGRRAFAATDEADTPVAYIILDVVDGAAHIEQVSVHVADGGSSGRCQDHAAERLRACRRCR